MIGLQRQTHHPPKVDPKWDEILFLGNCLAICLNFRDERMVQSAHGWLRKDDWLRQTSVCEVCGLRSAKITSHDPMERLNIEET
jgi:hypothetical protein